MTGVSGPVRSDYFARPLAEMPRTHVDAWCIHEGIYGLLRVSCLIRCMIRSTNGNADLARTS